MEDPTAEHEIRLRFLGNSDIFVTCKCYDKTRSGWRGKSMRSKRRTGIGAPSWKSLGDFPVGTPTTELVAAYNVHLLDMGLPV